MSHIVLLQTPDGQLIHVQLPPPPPEGTIGLHTVDLAALGVLPAEVPNALLDKFLNDMADRARAAANNQGQTAAEARTPFTEAVDAASRKLSDLLLGLGVQGHVLSGEKMPDSGECETLPKDKGDVAAAAAQPTASEAFWPALHAVQVADQVAQTLARLPFERMKDATDVLYKGSAIIMDCFDKAAASVREARL